MKCVHCGKPLPRSRRAKRTATWLSVWYNGRHQPIVHAVKCYKERKNILDHGLYIFMLGMRNAMSAPSYVKLFTEGDDPLIMVKDE